MKETHEHAVKRGKKSRASGSAFERKVRLDLEKKGWVVSKWMNQVELASDKLNKMMKGLKRTNCSTISCEKNKSILWDGEEITTKLISAKPKFNPLTKSLMMNNAGFPDFICFKCLGLFYLIELNQINSITDFAPFGEKLNCSPYEIIGVECKSLKYLDKIEKEKCSWLLSNNIFSKILIASKGQKPGEIVYSKFKKI
jgi:hypothetical protein